MWGHFPPVGVNRIGMERFTGAADMSTTAWAAIIALVLFTLAGCISVAGNFQHRISALESAQSQVVK